MYKATRNNVKDGKGIMTKPTLGLSQSIGLFSKYKSRYFFKDLKKMLNFGSFEKFFKPNMWVCLSK